MFASLHSVARLEVRKFLNMYMHMLCLLKLKVISLAIDRLIHHYTIETSTVTNQIQDKT